MSARAAAGMGLFVIIPTALQVVANETVRWSVKRADQHHAQVGLRAMSWLYDAAELISQYQTSRSDEEKRHLALAFKVMTGRDLESELALLPD